MSFYHFHLRTADGLERDEIGMKHPDLEAAYLDACRAIPSLMAELAQGGHDPGRCAFEITDTADQLLMEVPFLERLTKGQNVQRPAKPVLSPETQALFNQLELLTLSIGRETTRLLENMEQASERMARMQATGAESDWCFQAWSDSWLDREGRHLGAKRD